MQTIEERVDAICEHSTYTACVYLHTLRERPQFERVLGELELELRSIHGVLVATDIEQAMRRVTVQHPTKH